MAQVTESDYRTAQQGNAKVRQEFLDASEFCDRTIISSIINISQTDLYCFRDFEGLDDGKTAAFFVPQEFVSLLFSKRVGDVFILPKCWTNNFYDFQSVIAGHEMHHGRQLAAHRLRFYRLFLQYGGEPGDRKDYTESLIEIPAHLNELAQFTMQTPQYRTDTITRIEKFDKTLKIKAAVLGRDWKRDLSGVLVPPTYDDVVRERYGL